MRMRSLISVAALAAAASLGGQVQASTATVNVTLTIDAVLSINWCDTTGVTESFLAQTWAMGTGIALNTAYHTVGASPRATIPALRFIENKSNCVVDIAAVSSASTNWAVGSAVGTNTFVMEASLNSGTYATIHASVANFIADLPNHAGNTLRSTEIGLQLTTPNAVTIGGGRQQTITVTFTATAD